MADAAASWLSRKHWGQEYSSGVASVPAELKLCFPPIIKTDCMHLKHCKFSIWKISKKNQVSSFRGTASFIWKRKCLQACLLWR